MYRNIKSCIFLCMKRNPHFAPQFLLLPFQFRDRFPDYLKKNSKRAIQNEPRFPERSRNDLKYFRKCWPGKNNLDLHIACTPGMVAHPVTQVIGEQAIVDISV